jgi:hypothetical protein
MDSVYEQIPCRRREWLEKHRTLHPSHPTHDGTSQTSWAKATPIRAKLEEAYLFALTARDAEQQIAQSSVASPEDQGALRTARRAERDILLIVESESQPNRIGI